MYVREQAVKALHDEKKKAIPYNTARNQTQSLVNFTAFLWEKYHEKPVELCEKLAKEKDILGVCGVLQAWVSWSLQQKHSAATIRTRFWFIKDYLYDHGIELTNLQVKKNIKLPKRQKEELYPLSKEELRKIVDVASLKRKSLYLTQSSSGARIGELLQVRKKDIDTSKERWIIKLRSETTKTKVARSTFMSREAMKYTKEILDSKKDNDLVWAINRNVLHAETTEQRSLRGYLKQVGLYKIYEKTGVSKITTHSLRAYFFTHAVRIHGENYANKLTGHAGYLMEYDRYDMKQKLEMYLKLEPELLVYEDYNSDVSELREEIKKLKENQIKIYQLGLEMVPVNQAKKSEDEREGIKTPKVAEAKKCPTCNQESHDKIGYHYKCLNPHCEIDTFQA